MRKSMGETYLKGSNYPDTSCQRECDESKTKPKSNLKFSITNYKKSNHKLRKAIKSNDNRTNLNNELIDYFPMKCKLKISIYIIK